MRSTFLFALAAVALAQSPQTLPRFDVASVKPSGQGPHPLGRGLYVYAGGRIVASMCSLDYLVQQAFELQPFQISGPRWIGEEYYDIEAKPPADSKAAQYNPRIFKLPPVPEQRLMLRALLIDRFHLVFHTEKKEGSVYLLVKTNKELKLKPAKDREDYPWVGNAAGKGAIYGDGIAGINATMALLAERITPYLGRPVIDRTGIEGAFDFKSAYPIGEDKPDIILSLLTSLQGLGLKLEASRTPVDTLVIDRVERPTAN